MLVRLATCSCFQAFLLFILYHLITCDCPFPKDNLENGRFVYVTRKDANETTARESYVLRFKCYTGYERIGRRSIRCKDDEWLGEVPTCAKMRCPEPPIVENAQYELHSGVDDFPTYGSSVTYSCNVGFELNETSASTLHCELDPGANNARWKGERPFCIEKESCPDPGLPEHGSRNGDCCSSGDVLRYSCEDGYELVGKSEITCFAGNWSARLPLCKQIESCPDPGSSKHGSRKGDCCLLRAALLYSCEGGYELVGSSDITCVAGRWSERRPLCRPLEEDYCEVPPLMPHSLVIGDKDGDYFRPHDEAEIICEPGYEYKGPTKFIMCEEDGEWEEEFGECIEIFCDAPQPLENGTIPELLMTNKTSFPYNFELNYICDEGFRLTGGDSQRTCDENGWTGKMPRCESSYGFDISARARDNPKAHLEGNMEEEKKDLNEFQEDTHRIGFVPNRKVLDINLPDRTILYFGFDVSRSIGEHNFNKGKAFAKAIVEKVGISESGTRASAFAFSGDRAQIIFFPFTYATTEEVHDALDTIGYRRPSRTQSTLLSVIRHEAIPLVEHVLGSKGTRSIIFIITNGRFLRLRDRNSEIEAEEMKKAGVEIYCIVIAGSIENESLYKIASTDSSGEHPKVYKLQDYATLSDLVQDVTIGTVDYSECGLGMEKLSVQRSVGRVVGGRTVVEPWPWMAAIFVPSSNNEPECGGSIIHKNFILTAAHCLYTRRRVKRQAKDITLKLGLVDLKNETNVQEYKVLAIDIHPKYRPGGLYDYDVALLKLDRPIEYNLFVRPICLPPMGLPEDSPLYSTEEYGWVAGWGHTRKVSRHSAGSVVYMPSDVLKEVLLPIQPLRTCSQSLVNIGYARFLFTDRMFCAGDGKGGNDSCFGDSGGPFMQSQMNSEGDVYWTQVGIVSWGIGCAQKNLYGYYTHVQKLRPWIDNSIREALREVSDYSQCGRRMNNIGNERNSGRIIRSIGGRTVTEPWPWMAASYNIGSRGYRRENPQFECGGTIINENFILTAATCMYNDGYMREKKRPNDAVVKLGLTDLKNETHLQEPKVRTIYIHPKFSPGGETYDYDVALLQLERPIEFNSFVRPICLPPTELPADSPLYSPGGTFGWTIGWGHQEAISNFSNPDSPIRRLKSTKILKELSLPIQSAEKCIESLVDYRIHPSKFTDRMLCAGDGTGEKDTCGGDSGGPLMQSQLNSEGDLYWTQVGIVSWGLGCAQRNTYGYYSHVQRLRPWIDHTIRQALSEG